MVMTRAALQASTGPHGRTGLKVDRFFTREGAHPYDEVEWESRDAVVTDWRTGQVSWEQRDVEFPKSWSMNATTIVAQKYFRGPLGSPHREHSVRQMIDRVADTITDWGRKDGYFLDDGSADAFNHELKSILVNQRAAFNSPVWFNVGVEGQPQCSACFILSVEDTMTSILNWYYEEGVIFKGGSGSGVNLSGIRSSKEPLRGGGEASGPVSFMRGADASAGTIKCLHRDTLVTTDEGVMPIADVRPGLRVQTRFGLKPVLAVHDNGQRPLVKVRTALGDEIVCTPEHRFWVRGADGEGWREAGNLREDDYVLVDLGATDHGVVQQLEPVDPGHHTETRHTLPDTLDEGFALWLGWVYGDGSIAERQGSKFVAVQIGDSDPELVGRYEALVRTLFGEHAHVFKGRHGDRPDTSVSVRMASTEIIRFLTMNGLRRGRTADLRVPRRIQSSPAPVRAAFLSGLFEADGHVGSGYPTLSTVCGQFARDVHQLLLSVGIPSKVGRIDDRATAFGPSPAHTVRVIGREGVQRFAKLVGFVSERKSRELEGAVGRGTTRPFETSWVLPHAQKELDEIWASGDQSVRSAVAPYARYARTRGVSLLGARRLADEHPDAFGESSLAPFVDGDDLYTRAIVEDAGRGPVVDLTVEDVHEYLVHGVVTHNSGGKTRRAAKMVVLDVDHPDVEEFIWCKTREEDKIRALREAGFDMDLDGKDYASIQYQNANNSVRVTDDFMRAVEADADFDLTSRTTGEALKSLKARDLMRQIAQAAWESADPGVQYDTTINDWHTTPNAGRINASNPCSEYMHLDNSACNLASLNLRTFESGGVFDAEAFRRAVEIVFLAQEILVGNSSYPTGKIAENAKAYRQLGLGYTNLGGLLMSQGLAYDSDEGRAWAAAITALMTGHAYRASAEFARAQGPFEGFAADRDGMLRVIAKHRDAVEGVDADLAPANVLEAARESWDDALALGTEHGIRNAQASVLAPTGTISFLMDSDTTGIEPDLGLVKTKKLVGGGSMQIVNHTVPVALEKLGYQPEQIEAIVAYIDEHGTIEGAPAFREEHLPVFDCAMGERSISAGGHIRMMSAVQPFLSGAVSKTCNVPESATVEDIEGIYLEGWKLGLKALAIYRDNCKVAQPLSVKKKAETGAATTEEASQAGMVRRRLPKQRPSQTISFQVGDAEGYLTAGEYPGDGLGEIFVKLGKQGSTLSGVMDAFAISVSLGLQYGVPLEAYVSKFTNMRFEPAGMTDDPEVRFTSSLVDYIFRRLAIEYLPADKRHELNIYTMEERQAMLDSGEASPAQAAPESPPPPVDATGQTVLPVEHAKPIDDVYGDAPMCYTCGIKMQRAGSCHVCEQCGTTSGCS